jgi:hypothetical protein
MKEDKNSESGKSHALTMTIALAMLGLSVGVDVQKVWAESGPASTTQPATDRAAFKHHALQQKLDATQQKLRPSIQHKIPAVQHKEPVVPGPKLIDPPR